MAGGDEEARDEAFMAEAVAVAATARRIAPPNPWVGCLIVPVGEGPAYEGATHQPGGARRSARPWRVSASVTVSATSS